MASHRAARIPRLPHVGRSAAICAAVPAAALLVLGGVGVAAADSGNTGGQTSPCHENAVCAPINAGINAPVNAPIDLHDGIGLLDAVHLHR